MFFGIPIVILVLLLAIKAFVGGIERGMKKTESESKTKDAGKKSDE
jgi:hypothetical protein